MLALLISCGLSLMTLKLQHLGVAFIASLGWLVCSLQVYEQTAEVLPMGLMLMMAFTNFFLVRSKSRR